MGKCTDTTSAADYDGSDHRISKANGKTYSEVLAVVTRRDDGKLQNLRESLEATLAKAVEVRELSESSKSKTVVVINLEPLIVADDFVKALGDQFSVNADTQITAVGLSSKDAKAVLENDKIRLGWSICRVKERNSQPRCYRCLETLPPLSFCVE